MAGAVTHILAGVSAGESSASNVLLPLVYRELRQLAAARLRSEKAGQTLQATALVHEAYLRLLKSPSGSAGDLWHSRAHFFAAAAEAMRRILVENARRKSRLKRGGEKMRVPLEGAGLVSAGPTTDMLDVAEAVAELEAQFAEHATVVKLRYFVGMTIAECADALGVARPTIERRWRYARAWLAQRLKEGSRKNPLVDDGV